VVNGETLFARVQSFGSRLHGALFLTGLNYWQQHEGNYWGHNAVVRVQPFIEHCALPELPGSEPFGGRILSHDFVEAALMRRAGWAVWLAGDIEGSYEEGPPTLIDAAKRDRRWCQGNMQHAWLLTARGLRPASRFHLLMGVMGYVSSPLWLLFMVLCTVRVFSQMAAPAGSKTLDQGFEYAIPNALALFALTMLLLFLPKVAGLAVALGRPGEVARFGGRMRLLASFAAEAVISVLLAPINMMFHSRFVISTLLGQGVSWLTQRRGAEEDGTDWREAILTHGGQTVFGVVWGLSALVVSPRFFLWLSPVVVPLIFSIPISIVLSKVGVGKAARRHGLFLTPEETAPPYELKRLQQNLAECYRHLPPIEPLRADYGLLQAVLDPYVNALHVALLRQRRRTEESREWFSQLRERLLRDGPDRFTAREKMALLMDADSMIALHQELWGRRSEDLAEWWRLAMRQYNVLTVAPTTALYR
jgi:membrane glycosyltransferase